MKKSSFKSYVYGLTVVIAAAGMLAGCANSASAPVELESIDTLLDMYI